jgi:hypothetical protein
MPLIKDRRLPAKQEYMSYFQEYHGEKYIMEASPRYMHGGEKIARAIYEYLGPIKILFVLRNPIHRLYSFYKHMKRGMKIPRDWNFDRYVDVSLERVCQSTNIVQDMYSDIYLLSAAEGFYVEFLEQWFRIFGSNIQVLFFEHLKGDNRAFMREVCQWLDIDSGIYSGFDFTIENRSYMYKYKHLQRIAMSVNNRFEGFLRKNHRAKQMLRTLYYGINEETDRKEDISPATKRALASLYEPYNARLSALLSSKGYGDMPDWLDPH